MRIPHDEERRRAQPLTGGKEVSENGFVIEGHGRRKWQRSFLPTPD
jgi:hypothetical protein